MPDFYCRVHANCFYQVIVLLYICIKKFVYLVHFLIQLSNEYMEILSGKCLIVISFHLLFILSHIVMML